LAYKEQIMKTGHGQLAKSPWFLAGFAVLFVVMVFILGGCEDLFGGDDDPAVIGVTVTPLSATVSRGGDPQQFTATVTGKNNPLQAVTWSLDQPGRAAGTFINPSSGLLIVAADENLPTLTVRATSIADTSKSGTATVTVTASALSGSVTISAFIKVGQEVTANTAGLGGTGNILYQWAKADTQAGSFTDIPGKTTNVYTPAAADEGKWLKVTVTRIGYTGSKSSGAVQVQGENAVAPTVTGVTVSPASTSVAQGGTRQFTADVTGTIDAAYKTVTWNIETTNTAAGTFIDGTGLLTVAVNEPRTTLTVKATSTIDDSQSGTATVTVTEAQYHMGWAAFEGTYNDVQSYILEQGWSIADSGTNWGLAIGPTATAIYDWGNDNIPEDYLVARGSRDGSFGNLLNFQEQGIGLPAGLKNSPYTIGTNAPLVGVFEVSEYDMVVLFYVTRK
jgi:hypothetical protein